MTNTGSPFVLKSNEAFAQRQKSVFDQLNALESNLKSQQPTEPMEASEPPPSPNRASTRQFRGKESIFKRPEDPITKNFMRRMPDFKKNPHKWTKYSLDDVKEEDMSDKSNTRAALSFMNELRSRRSSEGDKEEAGDGPRKIVFKKRSWTPESEEEKKASFRSSKVVMPEYVVGQKAKKEKKNKETRSSSGAKHLKLDHLYEEDD